MGSRFRLWKNSDARRRYKVFHTGPHQRICHPPYYGRVGHRKRSLDRLRRPPKALNLLIPDHFEPIAIDDEIIGDVLMKSILLRRLTKDRLVKFVIEQIKPFMTVRDIVHVQLELEISVTGEIE